MVLASYDSMYRERYIHYCNSEPPKEDKAADDTANQKVKGIHGNTAP